MPHAPAPVKGPEPVVSPGPPDTAPAEVSKRRRPGAGRVLKVARALAMLAAVVGLVWVGLAMVRDPLGPGPVLARVLETIGLGSMATSVRDFGLTPLSEKVISTIAGLVVGVGGAWLLFVGGNSLIDSLSYKWRERVRPLLFLGPAMAMLGVYLLFPTISTFITSLTEDGGAASNYRFALTDPAMHVAFRNNLLWLFLGTSGSLVIGLLIATLVDRVRREALAKTFIFLPLTISMVGASVIWRFIYTWRPEGEEQIGLANAVATGFGADPVPWLQTPPVNTLALIIIMVWLQTGFAMVVLSAALKGVPVELIEAARIDGASEPQLFFKVIIPSIRGSIITVATAIFIVILKVFDIVFVMTGGRFDTEVVANRMFIEMFKFRNFGRASALAVVLMVVVVPFMVLNIRHVKRQRSL
jgi:alpha-glucoside transport system permease protein